MNSTLSKDRRPRLAFALLTILGVAGLSAATARADSACPTGSNCIVFDTDTGTVSVNGVQSTTLNSTPIVGTATTGSVEDYYFSGNLDFGANDYVTATGSRGLSLQVGNNVNIAPGATFNFSANGPTPGVGGGPGGGAGSAAAGGLGGAAGTGGVTSGLPSGLSAVAGSNGLAAIIGLVDPHFGGPLNAELETINFTLNLTGLDAVVGNVSTTDILGAAGVNLPPNVVTNQLGAQSTVPNLLVSLTAGTGVPTQSVISALNQVTGFVDQSGNLSPGPGQFGSNGQNGTAGGAGGVGVNNAGPVAAGGGGGQGGGGGAEQGLALLLDGFNGPNGCSAGIFSSACSGSPGMAGLSGGAGGNGTSGGNGSSAGANQGTGPAISGGNGGGGGGSGGGGGGGAGGTGGGGGGQGGNNDPIFGLDPGRSGGTGGNGGPGGAGSFAFGAGTGGGGGGAAEIVALGTITATGGTFSATGASGQTPAGYPNPGGPPSPGNPGGPEGACNFAFQPFGLCINSLTAKAGGNGGAGGAGGAGGTAGTSGDGGAGSGGTIKLVGSVVNAGGATVDTLGGEPADPTGTGQGSLEPLSNGGRVLIGSDTPAAGPLVIGGPGSFGPLSVYSAELFVTAIPAPCIELNLPDCQPSQLMIGTYHAPTQQLLDAEIAAAEANLDPALPKTVVQLPIGQTGTLGAVENGQNRVLVANGNDARSTITTFSGPTNTNPFIKDASGGPGFATPYIPNLAGGAEVFGLLNGVSSTDPFFASAVAEAGPGAQEALYRVHLGPAGYDNDFTGFDAVFLLNLTGNPILDPTLGVVENGTDDSFFQQLLQGGFLTNPLFGGDGPIDLASLPGFGVYEILVPDFGTDFNFGGDGTTTTDIPLEDNQLIILGSADILDVPPPSSPNSVPEPGSLAVLAGALMGFFGLRRMSVLRRYCTPMSAVGHER